RRVEERPRAARAAPAARQKRRGQQAEPARQGLPLLARLPGEHQRSGLSRKTAQALRAEAIRLRGQDRRTPRALEAAQGRSATRAARLTRRLSPPSGFASAPAPT